MNLSFETKLPVSYEVALTRVGEELRQEGFGILTRIDVRATFKEKLGVDFRPYTILGACNPLLAHRALSHDARAGLLLPCNVTVEALDSETTLVRIGDPDAMLSVGDLTADAGLRQVASEARAKLTRVAERLRDAKLADSG